MITEMLVLGTSAYVARDAVTIEYLKSKHIELSEEEKQDFLSDDTRRFIHFTSKESAEKIMQSGFLIPTKGVLKNHFTKSIDKDGKSKNAELVYMFDNKTFSVDDYIRNLPKNRSPFNGCYEYYAVSMKPNEYEITNFKRRAQDKAITYEGRLDIDGTDAKLVKYVLGLDENGKYKFDEVGLDFEYTPSQDLLEKLEHDKMGSLRYNLKTYISEVKKSRESFKRFKIDKEKIKEQIKKKKEFAKANRQFIEEQKNKDYIYEQNGEKLVVKNLGYEIVGGKKLQRLAMIKSTQDTKNKKLSEVTKECFMDEYDISNISKEVGAKYFFNNYETIESSKQSIPTYIGLPLENLETKEVTNEYDTTFDKNFKSYMEEKKKSKDYADLNFDKLNRNKLTSKIKSIFSRLFGKNKDTKLLEEKNVKYDSEDKEKLAKLGYSSVESMNKDDKDITILSDLEALKNTQDEISKFYSKHDMLDSKEEKRREQCL